MVEAQDRSIRAVDLYAGGLWSVVRGLVDLASGAGFRGRLWVISAGHGLVPADYAICPYSATFSLGHEDSVFRPSTPARDRSLVLRDWWRELAVRRHPAGNEARSLEALARSAPDSAFLVLGSAEYLPAIAEDLLGASSALDDADRLVVVSNSNRADRLGLAAHVVPSDPRLQARDEHGGRAVGGARIALHAYVARLLLEQVATGGWQWSARHLNARLGSIVEQCPPLADYGRRSVTDEDVRVFIRQSLAERGAASCTALLRRLRDGGVACEQKRFRGLYQLETAIDRCERHG